MGEDDTYETQEKKNIFTIWICFSFDESYKREKGVQDTL